MFRAMIIGEEGIYNDVDVVDEIWPGEEGYDYTESTLGKPDVTWDEFDNRKEK